MRWNGRSLQSLETERIDLASGQSEVIEKTVIAAYLIY